MQRRGCWRRAAAGEARRAAGGEARRAVEAECGRRGEAGCGRRNAGGEAADRPHWSAMRQLIGLIVRPARDPPNPTCCWLIRPISQEGQQGGLIVVATLPPPTRPSLAQRSLAVCQAAPAVALCSAAAAAPVALVPPPGAALPCSPRTEQAPRRARPGSDARAQPSVLSQILRIHHMRRGGPGPALWSDCRGRPGPCCSAWIPPGARNGRAAGPAVAMLRTVPLSHAAC